MMENGAISFADIRMGKVTNPGEVALASIAISLKRIADEVCGVPYNYGPDADNSKHRMGLTDGIMHAIEQGLIAATHRG